MPTGGGKTLSATAFALDHAIRNRKRRVIYVIPYTSIIEQTAEIFSGIFGAENVVEHHSNLDPDKETLRTRLASENWDAPVIVTTNVQFFESLYAAKTGRCRKLHNIVESVVILDEAQLLPSERLAPCVDVMNRLAIDYGVTIVLSTATQPALSTLPDRCPRLFQTTEIIPAGACLYERLKRVEYCFPDDLQTPIAWQDLVGKLTVHSQVLCVVNRRQDCHDLYRLLPPSDENVHLSALMCGEHRSKVIAEIKRRLKAGLPARVVSTQLIEAGVDIDFPVVFRAFAGFDSIAQAAGRCNREGKVDVGQVHVFVTKHTRGLLGKAEDTALEMRACGIGPESSDAFTRFFGLLYAKKNDLGEKWLEERLKKDASRGEFHFRTAGMEFKMIDDAAQRPVLVRYGANDNLLKQLRHDGPSRDLSRRLQRYTVNISVWTFDQALADGLVEEIRPGYWCWAGKYDEILGLDVSGGGRVPEDLIV
ncbi:MAG: DEAD/DEAH box helicase [Planctomycetota bacterium]